MTTTGTFVWFEYMAADLAAAEAFYAKVAGWTMRDSGMPGMKYTLARSQFADVAGMMTLPAEACSQGAQPGWMGYIGVEDVDAKATAIVAAGGAVMMPPTDIPGVGRFAVVGDPQGVPFCLFRGNTPPTETAPPMANGHIGWHELHTKDQAKAFDFYSAQFGWTKDTAMDMGPMGTYQIFAINGAPAGGMMNDTMSPQPYWLYYIAVGDFDAAVARVTEAGGKVLHGPEEVPGGAWIINASDPQGGIFALVGMRPAAASA